MRKILLILTISTLLSGCAEVLNTIATTPSVNYTRVSITAVRLESFSSSAPNGGSWDPLGGRPDIYMTLKEGNIISKRTTFPNVYPGTQLTWQLKQPLLVTNLSSAITIAFYDEEEGLNVGNDDYMGSVIFSPYLYKTGLNKYPSTLTLISNSSPLVKVAIELNWQ